MLPRITRYAKGLLLWSGLAALLGSAALVVYLLFQPPEEPQQLFTACNAIWLGHTWIEEEHSPEEIGALADRLQEHGIDCLYMHASPLNADGSFDRTRASYLSTFLESYRTYHSTATIYAWLGILTTDYEDESIAHKFDLDDYETMLAIKDTAIELVEDYGFDGVQLDIEPVESGSTDYLVTLAGLHEAMQARSKKLSLAVIFLADAERQAKWQEEGKAFFWSWLPDYYTTLGLFTDQLVVMHYNIGITDAEEFSQRVAWHAEELQAARAEGAAVLIGLPTYDYAYAEAENLESGLQGLALAQKNGNRVDGFAIYAEWTTDASEWALLD